MIRILVMMVVASVLGAADLPTAAHAERLAAEQSLATERTRISEARQAAVQQLDATARQCAEAESALAEATRRLAAAQAAREARESAAAVRITAIERRLAQLTSVVGTRSAADEIQRLAAQAGVQRGSAEVVTRDGHAATVPVIRLGNARALAVGDRPEGRGVVVERAGRSMIVGPPLPADLERAAAAGRVVVVDPAGTWGDQAVLPERGLREWLAGGRTFIWPILSVGALGVLLAAARWRALVRIRPDPVDAADQPVARVRAAAQAARALSGEERMLALERAVAAEIPAIQRGLSLILLCASISPLLGLLGTVTGMIDLFAVIGAQGSGNARSLTGGISEALITTQAGMMVAVPLLVAHALLQRMAEQRIVALEAVASATGEP